MLRPNIKDKGYWYHTYHYNEFNNYFNNLNYVNFDITEKSLYLVDNSISQSKLRESGFKITRDPKKADVIVINDPRNHKTYSDYYSSVNNECRLNSSVDLSDLFEVIENNDKSNFITINNLYKYLYKYEGNQELFNNILELLNSKDDSNTKIAMEFMSNANWNGNKIYLQEIFNLYYQSSIRRHNYKNGISFKGFLTSLDFGYETLNLYNAHDYRELCENEEHHNFVFKKYEDEFKEELDELVKRYKIKIDKIEFSIDRSIIND